MNQANHASEHFFRGMKALSAGDLAAAEARFLDALRLVPDRPSVLVNLSIVYAQSGRLAEALQLAERAVQQDEREPLFRLQKGVVQLQLGMFEDALRSFDVALAEKPDLAELHNNRANALRELGRPEDALDSYDKAIGLKPDYAEAHGNRALALKDLGRLDEALASADRAIGLKPGRAEAHVNRGNVLQDLGRLAEAIASYDWAIRLTPGYAEAYNNRGTALKALNRPQDALASIDHAIRLKPAFAEAYNNRGNALKDLTRLEDALASYDHAIRLKPNHADSHTNRGNVLGDLRRFTEALASHDEAIRLKPQSADAHCNRGNALKNLDRPDEAIASYDEAIRLKPGHANAQFNKSFIVLQRGKFAEGFELYQARWRTEDFAERLPRTSIPLWHGEPFEGELLLLGEQGIGDEVIYASMLSLLEQGKTRISLTADKRLHPAYERSFPGISLIDRRSTKTALEGRFDFRASIGDLGHLLKIDADKLARRRYPFLAPSAARRQQIVDAAPALKGSPVCGVAWKSTNPKFGEDKSIALGDLAPLLRAPGLTFVNLQYGDVSAEIESVAESTGARVHQVPGLDVFQDIDGLLSLIDACDVVLTTSNVTAHLAGAIGKKAAVLVPAAKGRIWYWHDQPQSIWYPSLTLFSQNSAQDWSDPIHRAAQWIRENVKWSA